MRKKKLVVLLAISFAMISTACSNKQPKTEDTVPSEAITETVTKNSEDPFTEDLLFVKTELPKKHVNPFTKITKEEFDAKLDDLIANHDQLNDTEQDVALAQIIASIGDGHTYADFWDGYHYPLLFMMFGEEVYIVDADEDLKDMINCKVTAIDGVDINTVITKLKTIIPHENDNWVLSKLVTVIDQPVNLYGLDIIKDENEATFTIEKDGAKKGYLVKALSFEEDADFVNQITNPTLLWDNGANYTYEYLKSSKALYFQYNVCDDMEDLSFEEFNQQMFDTMNENEVERVILDLRNNGGGNNQIINPFLDRIPKYMKKHPNVKMYLLIGRNTFSSGMDTIFMAKDVVNDAILVGEPTGEAVNSFGENTVLDLPNSKTAIYYSTRYYENSKYFKYKNKGIDSCEPDVLIQPSIIDYIDGKDPVLHYALTN